MRVKANQQCTMLSQTTFIIMKKMNSNKIPELDFVFFAEESKIYDFLLKMYYEYNKTETIKPFLVIDLLMEIKNITEELSKSKSKLSPDEKVTLFHFKRICESLLTIQREYEDKSSFLFVTKKNKLIQKKI